MTKISETIKHYESLYPKDKIDDYFEEGYIPRKISDLKIMLDTIGDVDLPDEYIKVFLYELFHVGFKPDYEQICEKIKLIYELCKDVEIDREELMILFDFYSHGVYRLMFDQIKELIMSDIDLKEGLKVIMDMAIKYGRGEKEKLELLSGQYSSEFVEYIQRIVQSELVSSDRVLDILPSKEFIEKSKIYLPHRFVKAPLKMIPFRYEVVSAQEFVLKRLESVKFEKYYQDVLDDEKIMLGSCDSGDRLYTSFTKGEYEEDLKTKKKLIRKK